MDVEVVRLDIRGYGGQPVLNQIVRQRGVTSTLTILLPGLGYTADMPLFYYAEGIALERGWDVLRVDYDYRSQAAYVTMDERQRRLIADVDGALEAGLAQRECDRVILIGKSLGTRAMNHLLSRGIGQDVWNVWLTPLIHEPEIRSRIEAHPGRAFVAIGTQDFAFDEVYLEELGATERIDVVVVEGADHNMDIAGDLVGSIRALEEVMSRLTAFLPKA